MPSMLIMSRRPIEASGGLRTLSYVLYFRTSVPPSLAVESQARPEPDMPLDASASGLGPNAGTAWMGGGARGGARG